MLLVLQKQPQTHAIKQSTEHRTNKTYKILLHYSLTIIFLIFFSLIRLNSEGRDAFYTIMALFTVATVGRGKGRSNKHHKIAM